MKTASFIWIDAAGVGLVPAAGTFFRETRQDGENPPFFYPFCGFHV